MTEYADRDVIQLDKMGGFYSTHIAAMTSESLHDKSDIAAELAFRDCQIAFLKKKIKSALIATHPAAVPFLLQGALDDLPQ